MPDIRLQDYVAHIKELIGNKQNDEAIAHCQHILKHHPKHIETYCLLGEACLEKEAFRESIEFFQRTLSADPENFIARVGLGIIYDGQGALPEAIWQMERAFELEPGNPEVRRELQRLYAQRDGKEKPRLKLTRGALGRLYGRNELYERAITEFRAVLRHEPDLPDVRVALVEALWHEGRRLEAVEACLELLDALPHCLKANIILAEIWMRGGHEDASEEKLRLARALDPENRVAQEMMGLDSPLPSEEIRVPELEYAPGMPLLVTPEQVTVPVPWGVDASEIVAAAQEAEELAAAEDWADDEHLPDWLQEIDVDTVDESLTEMEVDLPDAGEDDGQVPDWLRDLTVDTGIPDEEAVLPVSEPDVVKADIPADEVVLEKPEIEEISAIDEQVTSEEESLLGVGAVAAGAALAAKVPDWLEDVQEPEIEDEVPMEEELPLANEMPDWLQELGGEALEEVVPASGVAIAAEMLAAEAEVEPTEDLPEWLMDVVDEGTDPASLVEETLPEEVPAETYSAKDVPEWLRELEEPVVEEPIGPVAAIPFEEVVSEAVSPAEEVPDWLRGLEAPIVEEPGTPEAEVPTEEVLPEVAPMDDEAPDWLREIGAPVAGAAVAATDKALEDEPPTEEPEVVKGASSEAEVPESLWALVEAGILDESDIETAMAEMSADDLDSQRAEDVPIWLQELVDEEEEAGKAEAAPLPPVVGELPVVETPVVTESPMAEIPTEEELAGEVSEAEDVPDWLREIGAPVAGTAAAVDKALEDEPTTEEFLTEEAVAPASVVAHEEAVPEVAPPIDDLPDWLRELEMPVAEEPVAPVAAVPTGEVLPEADSPADDVPAWLRELEEPMAAEAVIPEVEVPAKDDVPEVILTDEAAPGTGTVVVAIDKVLEEESLSEESEVGEVAGPATEVPESLRALVEAGILDEADLETAMSEMSAEDLAAQQAEEVPVWLQELMGEGETPVTAESLEPEVSTGEKSPVIVASTEDAPDWLRELEEPVAEEAVIPKVVVPVEEEMPEGAPSAEEVPDWLRELEEPIAEEEAIPEGVAPVGEEVPKVTPSEVPGWLRELEEPAEEKPVIPGLVAGAAAAAIVGDALDKDTPAEEHDILTEEVSVPAAESPHVLDVEPVVSEVPESLQALVEAGILDEADLATAMAEMSPEELATQQAEDVPEWLQELMGEEAPIGPELVLPLADEAPSLEAGARGDIPDWLREFEEPMDEIPAPVSGISPVEEAPVVEETVVPVVEATSVEDAPEMEVPAPVVEEVEEIVVLAAEVEEEIEIPIPAEVAPSEADMVEEMEVPTPVEMTPVDAEMVEEMEEIVAPMAEMVEEIEIPILEEVATPEAERVEKVFALEVEETEVPAPEDVKEAGPEIDMPMAAPFERVEIEEEVEGPSYLEELAVQLENNPRDHKTRLELARAHCDNKEWNAALNHYERLVSSRKFLPAVADELESMSSEDIDRPRVFQLLGDVQMQEGNLDAALKMYKQARESLMKR